MRTSRLFVATQSSPPGDCFLFSSPTQNEILHCPRRGLLLAGQRVRVDLHREAGSCVAQALLGDLRRHAGPG